MKAKVITIATIIFNTKKKKRGRGNGKELHQAAQAFYYHTKQWRLNYQFLLWLQNTTNAYFVHLSLAKQSTLEKLFSAKLINTNRIYGQFKLPTERTHALSKLEKDSDTHSY